MQARIVKVGMKYQPEIYDEYYGWIGFSTIWNAWEVTRYPKRYWTRHGAMKMLKSLQRINV